MIRRPSPSSARASRPPTTCAARSPRTRWQRHARPSAAAPGESVIIVAGEWPPGVIGLVAGKLAEEHGRPTVVFCTTDDPWRGSARSAGGFDLAAAFASCGELFERFGGHPAAAGCHMPAANYEAFRRAMAARMTGLPGPAQAPDPEPGPRRARRIGGSRTLRSVGPARSCGGRAGAAGHRRPRRDPSADRQRGPHATHAAQGDRRAGRHLLRTRRPRRAAA